MSFVRNVPIVQQTQTVMVVPNAVNVLQDQRKDANFVR